MLALCWPMWALSWPMLAPVRWPMLGLCWPHVGSSWGLCWGYVGDMWDHFCWKTPRCQFFIPGPLRGTKNNQKTAVFNFRQRKNWDRPRLRNTAKNDVFVTSHTRNNVNFSGHGVNRGWVSGRGRSAYNLRLPRKASGNEGATALRRRPAKEHYRDSRRDEKLTRAWAQQLTCFNSFTLAVSRLKKWGRTGNFLVADIIFWAFLTFISLCFCSRGWPESVLRPFWAGVVQIDARRLFVHAFSFAFPPPVHISVFRSLFIRLEAAHTLTSM